jgi:polyisoprenoid-binding protein YceI
MKKSIFLLLLIPAIGLFAFPDLKMLLHVDTYNVDVNTSKIIWTGEKATGKHTGTISILSGQILNDHGKITGNIMIDMKSISNTDLEEGKKQRLEGHLKSDDFFGVEKYPTSKFEITSVTPLANVTEGGPNFNVTGNLTIKAATHELTFPALIRFEGNNMTASGDAVVNRAKYDVRFGSKTFFEDIGDKAISDDFTLKFDITATK